MARFSMEAHTWNHISVEDAQCECPSSFEHACAHGGKLYLSVFVFDMLIHSRLSVFGRRSVCSRSCESHGTFSCYDPSNNSWQRLATIDGLWQCALIPCNGCIYARVYLRNSIKIYESLQMIMVHQKIVPS